LAAYEYVESTGAIIVDTSTTLAEVQTEYQDAFGADLDLTPSTPQGILITAETLSRDGIARNNAAIANQINPNYATGLFLDAICALSGLTRAEATRSTVTATLTGTNGTVIPAGTRAETAAQDRFELITETTIPVSGTIDAIFQSVELGPIPCAIGALTTIVDSVLGWSSITNAAAATLGTNQETDLSLWRRRNNTLALQGVATTEAIISRLYQVDGVQSLAFRENTADTTQVIDTISMDPHSIYVCVNGGLDADVAQTILDNKSAGSAMVGTTTVSTAAASGQLIDVKFDRPTVINVLCRLTVTLNGAAGDILDTIKQTVVDYASGNIDGEPGFVVGGSVSPYELAGAVSSLSGVYVKLSEIAPATTGVYQTTEIAIAIDEIAAITLSGVSVIVV